MTMNIGSNRAPVKFHFVMRAILYVQMAIWSGTQAAARIYTTGFPLNENPISEGGNWINGKSNGLDWADVATTNGMAIGLESGFTGYDDGTALLIGIWGSNQTASATVFTTNRMSGNVYEEVEIRLRSSISAHSCTGYEVNFSLKPDSSAYVEIVRWNGPLGNFTYVKTASGIQCILHTGDKITGTITNDTITAYINGTQIVQGTDTRFTTGNPGIGIFIQGKAGVNGDYGFTSYTATDGLATPPPPNPELSSPETNGAFILQLNGIPETTCQIQYTDKPGPVSWLTLGNITAGGLGLAQLTNTPPPGAPQRFYRSVWP
jgi:hypothetical protein